MFIPETSIDSEVTVRNIMVSKLTGGKKTSKLKVSLITLTNRAYSVNNML